MVIALAGDGCFQMTENELATAVQYNAGVIIFVIDNEMYGTIRMHQHKNYKGKYKHTGLSKSKFCRFGYCNGWSRLYRVENTEDFYETFVQATGIGQIKIIYQYYFILKLVLKWFYLENDLVHLYVIKKNFGY